VPYQGELKLIPVSQDAAGDLRNRIKRLHSPKNQLKSRRTKLVRNWRGWPVYMEDGANPFDAFHLAQSKDRKVISSDKEFDQLGAERIKLEKEN